MAQSQETKVEVIKTNVQYITKKIDEIDDKLSNHYVSKDEFEPVKRIVYGLVSLILIAVVGALVSLVVNK